MVLKYCKLTRERNKAKQVMKKDHSERKHSNQIYWIQTQKSIASLLAYPNYSALIHPRNVEQQYH